jgi:hypothetical protein
MGGGGRKFILNDLLSKFREKISGVVYAPSGMDEG